MVFIETPASRAAWKTAAGAAETSAGSIALRRASDTLRRQPEQSDPPESDQPPISTLRMGRPTTPQGAPERPMPKSYSSSPPGFPGQYPGGARSPADLGGPPPAALAHAELPQ